MSAWDFLSPAQLVAGPRRVTADGEVHDQPVNRTPYLDGPTDQEVEEASGWLRWMLDDPRRVDDPGKDRA